MDVGHSLNPAIDIGQIEGAFVQGLGWCTMEELIWGDDQHSWARAGTLATRGPGAYKIPSFNDVPIDFRVSLLQDTPNPLAIHSSKAVGEPPLFLAASVFFAIQQAVMAARMGNGMKGIKGGEGSREVDDLIFFSPATTERIRMAVCDHLSLRYTQDRAEKGRFQPKGSW